MPAGLFFSTGIPTVVLVFKKLHSNRDIFLLHASNNFTKGKNQLLLRDRHIHKILQAYSKRTHVHKYAHKAQLEQIVELTYNLNIPRYVDTTTPQLPIDVVQVVADIKETHKHIAKLSSTLAKTLQHLVANKHTAALQLAALLELFKKQ